MTTVEANAASIFEDARHMRDAALERMAAGDVRDAAEKAWCATVRAAEALVVARTGQQPRTSTAAGRSLRALSVGDRSLATLVSSYYYRQEAMHGECFYRNFYDPGEIELLVNETADYVQEAERRAQA